MAETRKLYERVLCTEHENRADSPGSRPGGRMPETRAVVSISLGLSIPMISACVATLLVTGIVFTLDSSTNALGLMINNYFCMSLWTDPITKSGWSPASCCCSSPWSPCS